MTDQPQLAIVLAHIYVEATGERVPVFADPIIHPDVAEALRRLGWTPPSTAEPTTEEAP